MRGSLITIPNLCRAAGLILLGVMIATAIHGRHETARPPPPRDRQDTPTDPLAGELARCQSIGIAAESDTNCAAVWADNRRRFFTDRPSAKDAPALAPPPDAPSATR